MIRRCLDPHQILDDAFDAFRINGRKLPLVKSRLARYRSDIYWVQLSIVIISSFLLTIDILKSLLRSRPIIVREYWNIPLFLLSPLLFLFRKSIFFNINHNLTEAQVNRISIMYILCRMGFRFLLLDGSMAINSIPKSMQRAFLTPLFPVRHENSKISKRSVTRQHLRVSIVGDLRPEKADFYEIQSLLSEMVYAKRWEIRCGVRTMELNPITHIKDVNFFHTGSRRQYMQFLEDSDVVLIFAKRKQYLYRHSGTIMDAVVCGAIPLVPNFPVLSSQVLDPVPIGVVYDSLLSIPDILIKLESSVSILLENQRRYKTERACIDIED